MSTPQHCWGNPDGTPLPRFSQTTGKLPGQRALFFDLDHTLIRQLEGRLFPNGPDDWEFVPGIVEAIRPFVEEGFKFVIISNQGGIEAGHHTVEEVEAKLTAVLVALSRQLKPVEPEAWAERFAWNYCGSLQPHPDRKPNPGMVLHAIQAYGIDPQASYSVGDLDTDYQAFSAAGVRHYFRVDHFLSVRPTPEIHLFQ